MYSIVRLVRWNPGVSAAERAEFTQILSRAGGAAETTAQLIAPTLPGVRNGGDLIWHLIFNDAAGARAWECSTAWLEKAQPTLRACALLDSACFDHGPGGVRCPDLNRGIYRALFFALSPEATKDQAAQLEADLLAMPRHIEKILNWRLSRVSQSSGAERWSYVWEQEYAALEHLKQDYVWHPYHWGVVDRWFDPEMPCRIVQSHLCHSFAAIEGSLLAIPPR
jgi:Stress responsive A/B Barrel Domain